MKKAESGERLLVDVGKDGVWLVMRESWLVGSAKTESVWLIMYVKKTGLVSGWLMWKKKVESQRWGEVVVRFKS